MNLLVELWIPTAAAAVLGPLGLSALFRHRQHLRQIKIIGPTTGESDWLGTYRRLVVRSWIGRWLRRNLESVHLSWAAGDVLAGLVLAWTIAYFASRSLLALDSLGAMVSASAAVAAGTRLTLNARRDAQNRRFTEQLPEVAWVFSNALRAGMTVPQAMALLAREVQKPARQIFQRLVDEMGLAKPFEDVLRDSIRSIPGPEYELMVTIILIQYRAGGDLATAMEDLSHTLTERKGVQEEVQSATAGARLTATILPFMPLLCALVLNIAIPGALNVLFTVWGMVLLGVFAVIQWIAYLVIRRMADIKV